jgi:Zn-dependent protease with chaperone function
MSAVRNLIARTSVIVLASSLAFPIQALSQVVSQTRVVAPNNPYSLDKDIQVGQQAAREVERQMPILQNSEVQSYIEDIGQKLVRSIPAEFQHSQFRYSFKVVNVRDLNAFALPGGFTFVNRGLIEAAHNEGELVGAMAHEISHVALRHGTAQAAKARKYEAGMIAGQILGAVLGGAGGAAVAQGSQLGIGASFLRFSRDYEKQADILGSHIMANAEYDAHDLANMFRTLEQRGGSGGPQWMSDHPNPGNRFEYINREADALHLTNPIRNTDEFTRVQAILRDMSRAPSMQEVARGAQRYPQQGGGRYPDQNGQGYPDPNNQRYPDQNSQRYPDQNSQRYPDQNSQRYPDQNSQRYPDQNSQRYPDQNSQRYPDQNSQRYPDQNGQKYPDQSSQRNTQQRGRQGQIEYPSSRSRTYSGSSFRIQVPDNWRELASGDAVTFAPEGAYREDQGQFLFTHGIQIGTIHTSSRNVRDATDELINGLTQDNQSLRRNGGDQRETLSRREGLSVLLSNVSDITHKPENVTIYTAMLRNGDLFYLVAVAPQDEYQNYQSTFLGILRTVDLND